MIASPERPVIIVGAGIAGLAAAHELLRRGMEHFTVLEAAACPGGVIQSTFVESFCLETGPDCFLAAKPAGAELCRDVGLGDALAGCADAQPRTWILRRGRLEPLPEGWQLLAPSRVWPMLQTRLLSWPAKARMALELLSPASPCGPDVSVAAWTRAHLGSEVLHTLVAPLLAGVYGGDPEMLSFRAVLPRFARLAENAGILRALWRERRRASVAQPAVTGPMFITLRGGMARLPRALAARIGSPRLRLGDAVAAVTACDGGFQVRLASARVLPASAVIVASPAWAAAEMLRPLDLDLARPLAAIPYSSAATVHLAYRRSPPCPPGFGLLVPRGEGRRLLAATFVHQKFPHRVPPGAGLLRLFYGGALDPAALSFGDAVLKALAQEEVAAILRIHTAPEWVRVHRWPRAMPQYTLGHGQRIAQITASLRRHRGLVLAGAAHLGVGLSDVITSGQAAARQLLEEET